MTSIMPTIAVQTNAKMKMAAKTVAAIVKQNSKNSSANSA